MKVSSQLSDMSLDIYDLPLMNIYFIIDRATTTESIASYVFLTVSTLVTILAMWWLGRQMDRVKEDVIRERRKSRQVWFTQEIIKISGWDVHHTLGKQRCTPPDSTYPRKLS